MSSPDDIGIQTYIEALEAGRQEIVRLREQLSGRTMSCSQCDATAAEIVALRAENERLERWKREATEVIASWEIVAEMVTPRTQDLGRSKSDIIADAIVALRAEIDRYEEIRLRDDAVIRQLQATNLTRYEDTPDD